MHELHRKNVNGAVLKIDFEKAYDKVAWYFLQQTLGMKGNTINVRTIIRS
jgi:hypothetical protein